MLLKCKGRDLVKEVKRKNKKIDNTDRIFYWHIITLAKLNYRLKQLKGGK